MQCYKAAFILSLLFCPFLASAAGVAIAGTRVIYNEQSHEADITVKNTNPHDPVLIQSWVDDLADNNKSPFIVTPPLFRLDAGDSNDLRVLLTSAQLPNDRESLFTLNIKVIPANTAPAGENILQFAIKNQLKLIYRPAGLPGSALDAAQHLRWRVSGNHLQAENASPYYVTITTLSCAGQNQKTPLERSVIAPHSREEYSLPGEACAREVSWRILDDFGAVQTFSAPVSARCATARLIPLPSSASPSCWADRARSCTPRRPLIWICWRKTTICRQWICNASISRRASRQATIR